MTDEQITKLKKLEELVKLQKARIRAQEKADAEAQIRKAARLVFASGIAAFPVEYLEQAFAKIKAEFEKTNGVSNG